MNFWSDGLEQLEPYVPGEQPRVSQLVKLNTNENPYPPSPYVIDAIRHGAGLALERYPDPQSLRLRETVAQYNREHGLTPQQIFVGNGSDEVLAHAFRAFFVRQGRHLVMPDVTYSFYKVYCRLHGITAHTVALRPDWSIGIEDYLELDPGQVGGVVIANPNAPTGMTTPLEGIRRLLEHFSDQLVLVDEAYIDFGGETALALLQDYPNLLVVHTLSKSRALAGLRVGLGFGQKEVIDGLERVKDSFNSYPLGRLAQIGALAAYEDMDYYAATVAQIVATRGLMTEQLRARGFTVLPSAANFVFASHPAHRAEQLRAGLRERHVLVRHFNGARVADFLRITVGTDAQTQALMEALDEIL